MLQPILQELPLVQEQQNLTLSKTGNHIEAIEALNALVENFGNSSEPRGLLRGRQEII